MAECRTEFQIIHEPEHYNRNCGCMIPEAFTALIYRGDESLPKWPCGDSREEARDNVLREFPQAIEI